RRKTKTSKADAQPKTKKTKAEPETKAEAPADAERGMSALDAAVRALTESGQAMSCQEMIDVMAAKGYWKSPGGLTPAATLSAAIGTEIRKKGDSARFVKTERGRFALRNP